MKKKLAIISSYNESCGNATYTFVLRKAYAEHVDVEVLPLDLFLLQRSGTLYRRHADRHIKAIAKRLKEFDYVNIQFEAGLYGKRHDDVIRRLRELIFASKNVIVTMHRVDQPMESWVDSVLYAFERRSPKYFFETRFQRRNVRLYANIIGLCRRRAKNANVWIGVHTKRERRIVSELYKFRNVFDFPITFLLEEERRALLQSNAVDEFRARNKVPDGVKVVGAFGFLGEYKGYETLIRAISVLPKDYHLYIFGGQHPQSLRAHIPIDPYLEKIIKTIDEETKLRIRDRVSRLRGLRTWPVDESIARELMTDDLMDRVRFVGALPDPEFLQALRFSDAVVLPYLEVGQSMSGVVALALECGANLFCTNNLSFNEVRKYHGQVFHGFDIGNHIELAQKIRLATADFSAEREAGYRKYNIRNNVKRHLDAFRHSDE